MTTQKSEKREPFISHTQSWYNKPLDYKVVIYETNYDTHVAKVTMNRPEKMNSLSHQLRAEIFHALKVAEKDDNINVIILKGAGRCFSAGYDISGTMGTEEPDFGAQYVGDAHWAYYLVQQYWQIWDLSKVVIAQTHKYCLAGGTELLALCDLLVTTPDCQFGGPQLRSMSAPDILWFPWYLPMRKAKEFCFTGDSITGEQAVQWGMANYAVPEENIDEYTEKFAARVALMPWQLQNLHKKVMNKAYERMGIRDTLELACLPWALYAKMDWIKEWSEKLQKMPLRQWLTLRDGRYDDYRTAEKAILDRKIREGEPWKGVGKLETEV